MDRSRTYARPLRVLLAATGARQCEIAREVGLDPKRLSDALAERRPMSAELAVRVAAAALRAV